MEEFRLPHLLLMVTILNFFEFQYPHRHLISAQGSARKTVYRLSKPLIGDDGRVYACSERTLFAFESNGSIAWSLHLNYTCNTGMAPLHGGQGKIYLVAENRVLKVTFSNFGASDSLAEVFLGPRPGQEEVSEIIGLAVSRLSSSVFINIKKRGLFAYMTDGSLLWSVGPVLNQYGYSQGCRKKLADCYYNSAPVIDQCEASIYMSDNEGELYCLSVRGPYFKWIQDLSSFDKVFTITPGDNGLLYVTIPARALVLALDVLSGDIMWQQSTGPLGTAEYTPVVDSNGWFSLGSLDGFLYSFSPTGMVTKYFNTAKLDIVVQVSPYVDCSGYAVYVSQTEVEEKTSQTMGEYTYISAMRPKSVTFALLVPATGSIYWSGNYPGQFSPLLFENDLHQFTLDEEIVLAFAAASNVGNPLKCRTPRQKLLSSCSQTKAKPFSIYTGEERSMVYLLLLESLLLIVLVGVVRFCCVFWSKRKLQDKGLGIFLEKRRALQIKKKSFDQTITDLEKKAAKEAVSSEELEKLSNLVREREGIERKLSTTYSLGRDRADFHSQPLLPLHEGKMKSYSFQGLRRERITIFHTLSDTSSRESIGGMDSSSSCDGDDESAAKRNGKAPIEDESSSDDGSFTNMFQQSPLEPVSNSKVFATEHETQQSSLLDDGSAEGSQKGSSTFWLKRRRTLPSPN